MLMTREECTWQDYATYDENGTINGVRDDAPDEVKEVYKRFRRERRRRCPIQLIAEQEKLIDKLGETKDKEEIKGIIKRLKEIEDKELKD